MRAKCCSPGVKDYEVTAGGYSNAEIEKHLFEYYPTLNDVQRQQVDYRKWRRVVIVEGLRRGIIDKDPGNGPPERSSR